LLHPEDREIKKRSNNVSLLYRFFRDEQGQDLIEYTLLLAFVCLASAALFISAGGSIAGIWTATNSDLAVANTSAS
jgi:Flp pilus assembly pilin Flp